MLWNVCLKVNSGVHLLCHAPEARHSLQTTECSVCALQSSSFRYKAGHVVVYQIVSQPFDSDLSLWLATAVQGHDHARCRSLQPTTLQITAQADKVLPCRSGHPTDALLSHGAPGGLTSTVGLLQPSRESAAAQRSHQRWQCPCRMATLGAPGKQLTQPVGVASFHLS